MCVRVCMCIHLRACGGKWGQEERTTVEKSNMGLMIRSVIKGKHNPGCMADGEGTHVQTSADRVRFIGRPLLCRFVPRKQIYRARLRTCVPFDDFGPPQTPRGGGGRGGRRSFGAPDRGWPSRKRNFHFRSPLRNDCSFEND